MVAVFDKVLRPGVVAAHSTLVLVHHVVIVGLKQFE
jgi:hypothetical protein